MSRYSCFSLTGFAITPEGAQPAWVRKEETWYVCDDADCGRIVAQHETEYEARMDAFHSNAAERAWEKVP
jgi:hypothetical protein